MWNERGEVHLKGLDVVTLDVKTVKFDFDSGLTVSKE